MFQLVVPNIQEKIIHLTLILEGNNIGNKGVKILSDSIKKLTHIDYLHLDLKSNRIDDESLPII